MKTKLFFFTISLFFCVSIYAQKSDKSPPKSIELKLNDDSSITATKRVFPALNIKAIQKEDENDERNGLPPRFGYPLDIDFNLTNSGSWKILPNGDRIWRLEIECINAVSINLLYDKFWLPSGAKFHLYSKNKSQIIGGFNSENNRGTKQNPSKFTTGLLFSQSIILELYEPLAVKNQSIISIDKVVHGYRKIDLKSMMTNEAGHGDSGHCQVNVNCSEGLNWQNEKKGIAMILVSGTRWCSGSLVNNTSNNQTPYFLTADHCIGSLDANGDTDASYYSFWWNYESSTCSTNSADFVAESTSGATLVANNSASDFALFELTESPLDNNIDVYFNGWDRTTSPTQGGVGIHHPNGDFKKISTHNVIPGPGQFWNSNTHWRVNWSQTTNGFSVTEGGSSGSPLFTNNKRIIGQLHGSSSINCSDPANDPGEYGRFHVSWDGSSPQRRLKDWLDPSNTNQSFLNGILSTPPVTFQNGVDIVCDLNTTFTLQGAISTPTWSKSYNLSIVSSNNNSITVKALNSTVGGQGYVRASFANGTIVQKDIWVGKADVDIVLFSNGISESAYWCTSHSGNYYELFPKLDGTFHEIRLRKYPNLNIVYSSSTNYYGDEGTFYYTPSAGWYLFEVRRTNSCGTSDWFGYEVEFIDCSQQGGSGESEYSIYPNPSSESITIQKKSNDINSTNDRKIQYEFFDFSSSLIYKGFITNDKTIINVSNLKKGRYILKIYSTKEEEETHHIIIE